MSRDRDRKIEQALTHELRAAVTPDRDACVDAETLGAWADGGLEAAQMASVEWHVSTCARCQAIVGATARSAPLTPGTEAAGTFFLWRWWLAPLAATAAAVTLWMVVPQQRDIAVVPPSVVPPSVAAPAPETFAQNQPKDQPIPIAPSPAKPTEEQKALDERAQRTNTREKTREDRRERPAEPSGKKEATLAKRDAADAPKLMQDKNAVAAAAPAAPPSVPAVGALQEGARFAPAPLEIVSPDPSSRWRILNGAVERSEDGGTSWTAIPRRAGESITGGAAPARAICWLIGSSGLVMVTVDGLTFARVPLPEQVDLTAVTATDARTAIVTTADGRRFRTDDAGRTWRLN